MPAYQHKDRFFKKAKAEGLPSRASFKIEEILKKFKLVKAGDTVLDLGAAPGGWTVMLAKALGPSGKVLAIDLEPLAKSPPPNVRFFQGDIQGDPALAWLQGELKKGRCSCICSDMSPKLSGVTFRDSFQSYELGKIALKIAKDFLKPGGAMVLKQFPGEEFTDFLRELRSQFKQLKVFEPEASRKTSKEVYLVGIGKK